MTTTGGSKRELTVTSAYLPHKSYELTPAKRVREVGDYCGRNTPQLIAGHNNNARHIIQGSTDIKPQGEGLTEYSVSTDINILNKGN
jgi:hypothetical protein